MAPLVSVGVPAYNGGRHLVEALQVALGNLFRGNLSRPYDVPALIAARRPELALLESVAEERALLIASLRREIAMRLEILGRRGDRVNARHGANGTLASTAPGDRVGGEPPRRSTSLGRPLARFDRSRAPLSTFFRPPPDWMLALCQDLNEEIGLARQLCEEQLDTISRLHLEAASLLRECGGGVPQP